MEKLISMIKGVDLEIFYFFNTTIKHYVLDFVMPVITKIGDGPFLFVIAVLLLLWGDRKTKFASVLMLSSMTVSYYVVRLIKNFLERPRPFIVLPDVNTIFTIGGFSFPSGHATMAFALAYIFTGRFRRGYIFYSLAAIISFSRIYLGFHYISDIAAGALLGCFIGFILTKATDNIHEEA